MEQRYDYIVLGAGIIGLAIARELRARAPGADILVLEKEREPGLHASGRNSGVLHSGIYYPAGSVKARVCASGAKAMAAYCDEHGLPIARVGKVIVPAEEGDDPQIDLLHGRATANGARVELIDAGELRRIEPEARTASGRALYSPDTAVVDPLAILRHLSNSLKNAGVSFLYDARCTNADPDRSTILAEGRRFRYGHLFNATGQYADQVAKLFGVGKQYTMLPFKGRYYRMCKDAGIRINGLIYPVPNLAVPFLGVHSVRSIGGDIYFGPSAMPALGRENYHGVQGLDIAECFRILWHLSYQYGSDRQGFRRLMHEEAARLRPAGFVASAKGLVPRITPAVLQRSAKVGIRPQLIDTERHELVMDFLVEHKDNTTHVLNAISPAFTSAFSFAPLVVDGCSRGDKHLSPRK